jgi:hypothetical protein
MRTAEAGGPIAIAGRHALLGVASNVGILIWSVGATVCLFAATLQWDRRRRLHREFAFFLAAGILTSALLLDDLFMVHEYLAFHYLGLREEVVIAVEACGGLGFLFAFRRRILRSRHRILGLAVVFFAAMIGMDQFLDESWRWQYLFEEGSKLLGIAAWTGYFWLEARDAIGDEREEATPNGDAA